MSMLLQCWMVGLMQDYSLLQAEVTHCQHVRHKLVARLYINIFVT